MDRMTSAQQQGAAARNVKLTARQIEDLSYRLTVGEILQLRRESAALDLTLPQYIEQIIRSRHSTNKTGEHLTCAA
jgi:hypothetical protein